MKAPSYLKKLFRKLKKDFKIKEPVKLVIKRTGDYAGEMFSYPKKNGKGFSHHKVILYWDEIPFAGESPEETLIHEMLHIKGYREREKGYPERKIKKMTIKFSKRYGVYESMKGSKLGQSKRKEVLDIW